MANRIYHPLLTLGAVLCLSGDEVACSSHTKASEVSSLVAGTHATVAKTEEIESRDRLRVSGSIHRAPSEEEVETTITSYSPDGGVAKVIHRDRKKKIGAIVENKKSDEQLEQQKRMKDLEDLRAQLKSKQTLKSEKKWSVSGCQIGLGAAALISVLLLCWRFWPPWKPIVRWLLRGRGQGT